MEQQICPESIIGGNSHVFMALRLKAFMSRVGSFAFKEAVGVADNGSNFNGNLGNWSRD